MRTNPTHTQPTTHRSLVLAAVTALVLAACGGGDTTDDTAAAEDTTETAADDMDMDDDGGMDDMSDEDMEEHDDEDMDMDDGSMDMAGDYGEPADPSEADRVIEVNVDNDLAFEPADFEVATGEVITFRITNTGDIEHEFVLGDEEAQDEMAEMMDSGDDHAHSGEMSNAVTIHGGETAELTWRFTTPGTVLIGCHVPGHYESGMTGTVTVSG
jgi:uncharacterized cupredoxin-like copper-binding protein